MILVVLGMHRSGTSAVAKLLSLCGASLGPEEELLSPAPDNPRGFFENRRMMELDERLLAALGGTSTCPPPRVEHWDREDLAALRDEARALAARVFPRAGPHVWKDPRACLTFGFWREILAPAVVVIPVRNPLEIALSLEKRDGIPVDVGLCLWEEYMRRALESSAGDPRTALRYDRLVSDPPGAAERLVAALSGLGVRGLAPPAPGRLREFIDPALRHAALDADEFARHPLATSEQRHLFQCLLAMADDAPPGPVPERSPATAAVLRLFGERLREEALRAERDSLAAELDAQRAARADAERQRDDALAHMRHITGSKAWRLAGGLQRARRSVADALLRVPAGRAVLAPVRAAWRGFARWRAARDQRRVRTTEAEEWLRTRHSPSSGAVRSAQRSLVHVILTASGDPEDLVFALLGLRAQSFARFHLTLATDGKPSRRMRAVLARVAAGTGGETPLGATAVRNWAVAEGPRLPYVVCVESNRVLSPAFLERTLSLLEHRADLGLAWCDEEIQGTGEVVAWDYHLPSLLRADPAIRCFVVRRPLWDQVGGLDESLGAGAEWDFLLRCAEAGWCGERIPERGSTLRAPVRGAEGAVAAAVTSRHPLLLEPQRRSALESVWAAPAAAPTARAAAALPPRPAVSVVVPCFNQGDTLDATIRSVRAQTYTPVEIVVVDDGSTHGATIAALARLDASGVRVIRQANAGLGAARNAGIAAAQGELVLPLDSDDVLLPEMIERCVDVLRSDPACAFVYTDMVFFGDEDGVYAQEDFNPSRELTTNHATVCALFRKSDWQAAGGYATELRPQGIEDWDLWVSLTALGRFGRRLPQPLFAYRRRRGSMGDRLRASLPALITQLRVRHPDVYRPAVAATLLEAHPPRTDHEDAAYAARPRNGPPVAAPARFSVAVPIGDGAQPLDARVKSVLGQDGVDLEVLLLAPRSGRAETWRALDELRADARCRVLETDPSWGVAETWNRALDESRMPWIVLLDERNELLSGALAAVRDALRASGPARLLSAPAIDAAGQPWVPAPERAADARRALPSERTIGPLLVVAREAFDVVGPFDPSADPCCAYDFALRCAEEWRVVFLDRPLVQGREAARSPDEERAHEEVVERIRRRTRLRRFLADDSVSKGELFAVEVVLLGEEAAPPSLPRSLDRIETRLAGAWPAGAHDLGTLGAREREALAELGARDGPPWVLLVGAETSVTATSFARRLALAATHPAAAVVPGPALPARFLEPLGAVPLDGALFPRSVLCTLRDVAAWRAGLEDGSISVVRAWGTPEPASARARALRE